MEKGKSIILVLAVLVMFTATAMVATAQQPSTPFHVYGWVKYSNGTAMLGPNVNITNLNTSESYTVETNASYSYYQVITSSCNVSAGDVLNFSASDDGNSANRTATVTSQNMTEGGLFEQNLTIVVQPQRICGDVDNDGYITGGDATKVWDVACHVSPPSILDNPWAADVDCDGFITGGDATKIWDVACHVSPESILHCCP
ncbi:hypothetical protein CW713_01760 [Methanophagales archaeon]|nr:MAG: hypothetical protein CW713_01760 [Methanophagales archaeon]